jgi:hypothetical protein
MSRKLCPNRLRARVSAAIILMVGLVVLLPFSNRSATSKLRPKSVPDTRLHPATTAHTKESRDKFLAASSLPLAVNITSPANGAQFSAPAVINVSADATDPDGILKVDFFHGSTLLASDNTFPYGFSWTNVPACSFFLTAKATNNLGLTAASNPILINVTDGTVGESTPPNFKIAFMSDEGLGPTSVAALNLVKNEGAQALVVSGDLDYSDSPSAWEAQLNSTVGSMFPVLALSGNHDEAAWNGPTGYQQVIQDRFARIGIPWCGTLGVQSALHYKGIFFVFTTPGLSPTVDLGNNDAYIRNQLAVDHSVWSISSWHKNMHLMQAGGKSDETGWEVYEESRAGGAITINGHEHSYFRTHLLSSMINQTVASTSNTLAVTKGSSFVAVSGLGGKSRRNQEVTGSWIAKIYATPCLPADPICQADAVEGALFGVFNVDGQMNKANFYFKDVNGQIIDSFTVISEVDVPSISGMSPTEVAAGGGDFALTVNGANFINESAVRINGSARPTTFINSTQLTAQITAADILNGGVLPVSVINAVTGGGTSNQLSLSVTNPSPTISALAPVSAEQGLPDLTLTVTGTGFVSGSVVRFNGLDRVTTYSSPTSASATLTSADLSSAGISPITVFNPAPGGGLSNAVDFTVNNLVNPVPLISSVSPTSKIAGEAGFTLTVNGGLFTNRSVVRWNGSDRLTTFVDSGHVTAQISAADIATAAVASVTLFNPSPGGGTSNALSFIIDPNPRTLSVIDTFGGSGATLSVPIMLTAQGDENAIGFSLNFDPALLSSPQAVLGADAAGATLSEDSSQAASGRFGVLLSLPSGQSLAAGTRRVVTVTFTSAAVIAQTSTQVGFGDQPTGREIVNISAQPLLTAYSSGTITLTLGYEGDVAPRPNGNNNGTVTVADWVQCGRFGSGLDSPTCDELQRADTAPRSTLGNSVISIADWVQCGRYAAGLDSVIPAGGPSCPTAAPISDSIAPERKIDDSPDLHEAPVVQLEVVEPKSGAEATVRIILDAAGGENALGVSLTFLPSQSRFVSANRGPDARDAALVINADRAASGSIGISLVLPPGHRFAPGRRQLVVLTFKSLLRDRFPEFSFADSPVKRELVNVNADVLTAKFVPLSSDHTDAWLSVLLEGSRLFPNRPYASLLDFLTNTRRF